MTNVLGNVVKVAKVGSMYAVKYAGPVLAGVMTIASEIESQKLKNTVKVLGKEVAELKAKMK